MTAASPGFTFGYQTSTHPALVSSEPITAVVTGGVAPYTYTWVVFSDYPESTVTAPANATTSVTQVLYNETVSGTLRCTVTDSLGSFAICEADYTLTASDLL